MNVGSILPLAPTTTRGSDAGDAPSGFLERLTAQLGGAGGPVRMADGDLPPDGDPATDPADADAGDERDPRATFLAHANLARLPKVTLPGDLLADPALEADGATETSGTDSLLAETADVPVTAAGDAGTGGEGEAAPAAEPSGTVPASSVTTEEAAAGATAELLITDQQGSAHQGAGPLGASPDHTTGAADGDTQVEDAGTTPTSAPRVDPDLPTAAAPDAPPAAGAADEVPADGATAQTVHPPAAGSSTAATTTAGSSTAVPTEGLTEAAGEARRVAGQSPLPGRDPAGATTRAQPDATPVVQTEGGEVVTSSTLPGGAPAASASEPASRAVLPSAAAQRVLDIVSQLEDAPPPRVVVIESGELRVRVGLDAGVVRLTVLGEVTDAVDEALQEAADALASEGFETELDRPSDGASNGASDGDRDHPASRSPSAADDAGADRDRSSSRSRAGLQL